MKISSTAKFWDVRLTIPAVNRYKSGDEEKAYPYKKNIHLMIAAESVAKVNELVLSEYPDATIHQINHRGGDCGIIVQMDLLNDE